jgi:hypothetical protein
MKVFLSKPRDHWISPYTMLDYAFFWTDWSKCSRDKTVIRSLEEEREHKYVEHPEWVEKWSDRLTPISQAIQWVWDRVHPKIEYVKIDRWDTWSMDHTLAHIILPMLKQLKEKQHGAGFVDDQDVPEGVGLRSTEALPKENEWDTDSNHFARWNWVMNEMIFAFECKIDDSWEDAFHEGDIDMLWVPVDVHGNEVPKGEHKFYQMKDGPKDTYKCDYDGMKVVQNRIDNGFRLFGRYYQNLWD